MKALKISALVMALVVVIVIWAAPIGPMPGVFIGGTETPVPALWGDTRDVDEIRLQVGDGLLRRVVIIWVVQVNGDLYVVGARNSGWTSILGEGGPVRLRLGDKTYRMQATSITSRFELVLEAYVAKYQDDYPEIVQGFPELSAAAKTTRVYRLTTPDVVDESLLAQNLATAEGFIDAFYSFDPERLGFFLEQTDESASDILYYQGWAEGGNYQVLNRAACVADSPQLIHCAITVKDDPVQALKTGFDVTDTFHLTFAGPNIVSIDTSSNDQPIYHEARKWVEQNKPEVMAGPCLRSPDGGTPGDCARAMTQGYRIYYETVVAPASE